jgi:hypothetical protein
VAANLRNVALVVSSDWMVEWHQDSVLAHLHPFVVTPHVLDHEKQKVRRKEGEYAATDGAGGDLNDRYIHILLTSISFYYVITIMTEGQI